MISSDLETRVAITTPEAEAGIVEADPERWYDLFPELYELENGSFFSQETKRTAIELRGWLAAGEAIVVEPYGDPIRPAAYVRRTLADYEGVQAHGALDA